MSERHGIIAIGNLLVDQSLLCDEYPRESMLAQISSITQSCGGGCTNVLFDLATMDPTIPLSLCGVIGPDEAGAFILNEAQKHRVDTSRVRTAKEGATSFTYVMVNERNGYRTFFHHMGANRQLEASDFANLNSPAKIAHVAYLLLLPSLEQNDATFETTGARALAALREQGFRVSLDLVSAPDVEDYQRWVVPVLPQVDYLIINDEEAKRLTQNESDDDYTLQARALLDMGVHELVCIHYPNGAVGVSRRGESCRVDAYHVAAEHVVSTLGAGDAFCAGMLYGIHQSWPLEESLRLGCASAHFNLFSLSATEGAQPLARLQELIATEATA